MSTYFISDLHLCEKHPQISRLFVQFCREKACHAQALYILGDLFEYWLGDDAIDINGDKSALMVQKELLQLSQLGVEIYYMAGNRDFLLGQSYANSCGMRIIEEPFVIDLYGEAVLLVHGDAECIDDIPYQQARTMLRNPKWQQQFLNMDIEQRIEFAEKARQQSQQHTQNSTAEIMDVNQQAVNELFQKHQVKTIIHGHTHRPAIHQNHEQQRIVLGDWHQQSSYLVADANTKQLISA
jgi:UDP-2,3-diacylglucosamine hydrolase